MTASLILVIAAMILAIVALVRPAFPACPVAVLLLAVAMLIGGR